MSSSVNFSRSLSFNTFSRSVDPIEKASSPQRINRSKPEGSKATKIAREKMSSNIFAYRTPNYELIFLIDKIIPEAKETTKLKDLKNELSTEASFNEHTINLTLEAIEELIGILEGLTKRNEEVKALNITNLVMAFVHYVPLSSHNKIYVFQALATTFFMADKKSVSLQVLKQACSIVDNLSTIEEQLKAFQELAKDFSVLGEGQEIINIFNQITDISYFSFDQKYIAFQEIFNYLLDNYTDLMLHVIEHTKDSLEKDYSLKMLISWVLKEAENEDKISEASQIANCIQNPQIQAEAIRMISKEQDPSS